MRAAAEGKATGARLRQAGNKAFQRGRLEEAVQLYSEVRLCIACHFVVQQEVPSFDRVG